MTIPYKCPVCDGEGERPNTEPTAPVSVTCKACSGSGVVWSPVMENPAQFGPTGFGPIETFVGYAHGVPATGANT